MTRERRQHDDAMNEPRQRGDDAVSEPPSSPDRKAGKGVAARHLDWQEHETIGEERGGRHPYGQVSDTTPPPQQHEQMTKRIARGPGDDASSLGDDIAASGNDVGVLGGDPAGRAPSEAGHAGHSYGTGTGEIGGLGGRPARQLGGLDHGATSLGGIGGSHAAGEGAGLDAGPLRPGDISGWAGSDTSGAGAPHATDEEPLDEARAENPIVSEREHARRSVRRDPRLGEDADQLGGQRGTDSSQS